ncbi:MAG: hypothetical protein ACRYFZ_22730 [Janthinobacterium lividum]
MAQYLLRGAVTTLAGSVGLAAGNFGSYTRCPAREAGDILALKSELSGPLVFSWREQRVAQQGGQGVLAELVKHRLPGYMRFHVILG